MLSRVKLIKNIRLLPDKVSLDEVIDRIYLLEKIETGLQQSKNGQVTSDEELNKKLPEWLV
ncbi:MAG: hypothetical protein ACOYN5_02900 [Bacteroidales bacterium]